jgi:hypothetical protein
VWEHSGNLISPTLLTTVSVVAARGGVFSVSVSATQNKQLAVRLSTTTGNVRDLGVDIVLKGGGV